MSDNSSRRLIVAGNWKMNKTLSEAVELTEAVVKNLNIARTEPVQVIMAPPYVHLYRMGELVVNKPNLELSGQNCHQEISGAYTGEISAAMLRSLGAGWVILGHSERRQYFGEDDALINAKVKVSLEADLQAIVCVGEMLPEREAGKHFEVVGEQLRGSLEGIDASAMSKIVIAYEPVWAIGTGVTASPEQAQEVHAFIRAQLAEMYSAEVADSTTILYGGSCKPSNAADLFAGPDLDGGLIGGASLKADDFLEIVAILADSKK
jgi:triosephosphate isomerase